MAGGGLALLLLALLGAHAAALQSFNDTTLPGCAAQVNHVSFTKQTYDFGLAPGCPQFAKSLLPHHFYSKPKDASPSPRPGGVAVASLIDASGAVVCTGALVSDQHVLTSLGCALLLRGDNGTAGNYTGGRMVRIGNETYSVVQEMLDPRGRHEELALLTLDRTTPYAAVPMDDGGHIGSPGSAECNSLATELVEHVP
ncbi:hypothetical protein T484DRAFT_1860294 [Baffinella frigidus]|nr:hypothetical protein T484DRAFT_1860294 [Cryptophyta sp. CCMP2293]